MAERQPTLEDLRLSPQPAWLWDGTRGRLVWANSAGVAAFDARTLFDLIDRAFDPREAGVAMVMELSTRLERDRPESVALQFPSVGVSETVNCRCWLHNLADGTSGVLVVQEPAKQKLTRAPETIASAMVEALPLAVFVLDGEGAFVHGNGAAQRFASEGGYSSLADLLQSKERAAVLLGRLAASSLVTSTEQARQRDFKCSLSRAADGTTLLSVEDITERRALEQDILRSQIAAIDAKIATSVAPLPSPAQAFETLGKSIEDAVRAKAPKDLAPPSEAKAESKPLAVVARDVERPLAKPVEKPETIPAAIVTPRKVPFVPDAIRMSLERTGQALLVGRDNEGLFATAQAAKLLGYDNVSGLFAQEELWPSLFQASSGATVSLVKGSGETEAFACTRATIPWLNGSAHQFILQGFPDPEDKPPRSREPAPAPAPVADTPKPVPDLKPEPIPVPVADVTVVKDTPLPQPVPQPKPEPEPVLATTPAVSEIVQLAAPVAPTTATDPATAIDYEELKAILDVASDGIITLDDKGSVLSFSAGAEAIFGLTQAEVLSRNLGDLLKPESRKLFRDYLAGFTGPGLASVFNDGREVQAATREGNSVPLFLSVSRLQSPQSRASLCAVVRDITTWKRTEVELREAKDKAEQASRQKSDFLARISHELRTPLNAIMGFSEVMRTERFGELRNDKYRSYANDIHDSGKTLLSLINDLLDLSKVEAGKLELNFTAESLTDATEHAMRQLQEEARNARVLMRTAFPPKLPRVVADHRALRQILSNLISNAVKYTNAGGQVVVSAQMEQDGSLLLRIKDTGIGMTEAQLADALHPFTRVETVDRARQGTGLGLPLTKALTEANRARFRMTSAPNQGTTAEIIFPGTRVLAE